MLNSVMFQLGLFEAPVYNQSSVNGVDPDASDGKRMSVEHSINHDARLIVTVWNGPASGQSLMHALRDYQDKIKADVSVQSYHELLDFRLITKVDLSAREMLTLSRMAQLSDLSNVRTRLALVVASPLIFGLSRMYIAYRTLVPNANKDLAVFKSMDDAKQWLYPGASSS